MNNTIKHKSEDKYKKTDRREQQPWRRKMRGRDNKDDQVTSHAEENAEEKFKMSGAKK